MKYMISLLAASILLSASSFAAKEITREESLHYTKIAEQSVTQSGTPSLGHKELSREADKKCHEFGKIKAMDCYYLIVDKTGNETNHKNIDIEIFKK